jgi:type II secretory pathway component PulF
MDWLLISWPSLILLGVSLRMSLRLTYGARGPEVGDPVHAFLNIAGWVLIALGIAPAIVGGVVSVVGVIVLVLAIATLVEIAVQRRAAQRRSMCRMLSLVAERGAHLESSVFLAGQSMGGTVGNSARLLFKAMSSGMPLAAAIARYPKALPPETLAYLAAGTSGAARVAALRELSQPAQGELNTLWRNCIDRIAYLLVVILVMAFALAFIMYAVVPEYAKIFDEFDLELPIATQLAISVSQFVSKSAALPLVLTVTLIVIAAAVIAICYLCDEPVLNEISDRLFRGRHVANVLRILALATESHEPLADVLNRIANVYPAEPARKQLVKVAKDVRAGTSWEDALRTSRIVNQSEQSLLKTAEKVGNLPWALREIARRREKLIVYWLSNRLQVIYPFIILLLGLLVRFTRSRYSCRLSNSLVVYPTDVRYSQISTVPFTG